MNDRKTSLLSDKNFVVYLILFFSDSSLLLLPFFLLGPISNVVSIVLLFLFCSLVFALKWQFLRIHTLKKSYIFIIQAFSLLYSLFIYLGFIFLGYNLYFFTTPLYAFIFAICVMLFLIPDILLVLKTKNERKY